MAMQNLFYGGIYEEKTFLLPNGLTNSLLISIEDQSTDLLYCDRPLGGGDMSYGQGVTMSASQLGGYLFHLTNPTKYRWAVQDYNRIDENQIHLTTRRQLVIKLRLSSEVFVSWNLMQTLIADPATYTSKTLPDRVKAEVKKGYDEAEKSDQYYGIPNSQSKKNPPPR